MEAINNLLAGDFTSPISLAIMFVALLVAILLLFWLVRLMFGPSSRRLSKNRQPRLSITDAAVVDDKRRLVLLRRDDVEHLVMIGGPSDIVVEQNIVRAAPVTVPATRPEPTVAPAPAQPAPAEPTPIAAEASRTEPAVGPAATAAVFGTGAAAASQAGSGLTEAVSDTASAASSAVTETVSAGVETAADAVEAVSEAVSNGLDTVTDDSKTVSSAEPALETDTPKVSGEADSSKTEDEMQRLLNELAAEKT